MPAGMFCEKACAAVCKNFHKVSDKPSETGKQVLDLRLRLNLGRVCSDVKKLKGLNLETFVLVKTHKLGFPSRAKRTFPVLLSILKTYYTLPHDDLMTSVKECICSNN